MAPWYGVSLVMIVTRGKLPVRPWHLYGALRLYVNFFQPSFKLIDKTRDGATTVKRYSPPTMPCDRLIQQDETSDEMRAALTEYRARLDPVLLLHTIREAQSALVAATAPEVRETPSGESLSRFLAKLPRLWRQGEVRPTHAARVRGPRHWREPAKTLSRASGATCWSGCRPSRVLLARR